MAELCEQAEDYVNLAKDAVEPLSESARDFCRKNNFTFVEIPHEIFAKTYEKQSGVRFREWLNQYCTLKGMTNMPQIAIVGPRVKTLESAERKTELSDPSRNSDYLGIMLVVLQGNGDRTGLNRLAKAIQAIENDPKSLGRKNYYWEPHDATSFRGHKSVWKETCAPNTTFGGYEVLAEVKIEHEAQMDADKLTRMLMDLNRQNQKWLSRLHDSFGGAAKQAATQSSHTQAASKYIGRLGREIYNFTFDESGLNRFMNPALAARHAPMEPESIRNLITGGASKFYNTPQVQHLLRWVEDSGVLPPSSATSARSSHNRGANKDPELSLHL